MKNDLISRRAAIEALKGLPTWWADAGGYYGGAQPPMVALLDPEDAVSAIENLPSAQPERKGEWIIKDNPGTGWYRVTCSECWEDVTSTAPCIGFYPNAKVTWDYCPNCGSYNGGDEDDSERREE